MTVEDTGHSGRVRRRSRSSKAKTKRATPQVRLKRTWQRHLGLTMAVLTIGFAGYAYFRTYTEAVAYDALAGKPTKEEALYVLGKPGATRPFHDGESWSYRSGDRLLRLDFGADGRMKNLLCASRAMSPADCQSAFHVTVGMSEDQVWYLLGKPPVQLLEGTNKIIAYPSVGLTLKLQQFRVAVISRQLDSRPFEIVPMVLRRMVP